jgi:hypothetical protein
MSEKELGPLVKVWLIFWLPMVPVSLKLYWPAVVGMKKAR